MPQSIKTMLNKSETISKWKWSFRWMSKSSETSKHLIKVWVVINLRNTDRADSRIICLLKLRQKSKTPSFSKMQRYRTTCTLCAPTSTNRINRHLMTGIRISKAMSVGVTSYRSRRCPAKYTRTSKAFSVKSERPPNEEQVEWRTIWSTRTTSTPYCLQRVTSVEVP